MSKKDKTYMYDLRRDAASATVDEMPDEVETVETHERAANEMENERYAAADDEPRTKTRTAGAPWTASDPRYQYVAIAIVVAGALLRLLYLQTPPFMHDEGIHAIFAYNFSTYKYDPVYHGPLLYHLVAVVFAILGDYDFTARLVPALLGIGLLLMIVGPARGWLGDRAALWSAALIAISPVMVTYHRRLLHDALVLVLTLGAVLCFQRSRETSTHTREGKAARIGFAAIIALFLCTKANAFFIIVMLFSFGVAMSLRHVLRKPFPLFRRVTTWVPLAMLIVVGFAAATAIPEQPNVNQYERMFTVVCFFCSFVVWEWLRRTPDEEAVKGRTVKGARRSSTTKTIERDDESGSSERAPLWLRFDWQTPVLCFCVVMFILAFFYGQLYLWWREPSKIPAHLGDTMGALPWMMSYWGGQQRLPRLASGHDYYIILMLVYELPIVVAAIGGFWRASRHRSPFTDLLIWWSFTSFTLYAMANEKVPWLLPHIMLPLTLMAGWWLANLRVKRQQRKLIFAAACALGAVFLLRGVSATNFERGLDHHEPMFFAHTTESFRDSFFAALNENRDRSNWIWVDGTYQWPMAWYLRDSEKMYGAKVWWGVEPPRPEAEGSMRMAVSSEPKYINNPLFNNWHKFSWDAAARKVVQGKDVHPDLAVWPRASWGALRLDHFPLYWATRQASVANGVLSEDNHQPMVIATAP